ncbi:unnamed protein product [Rotaria magnacalcarata]|uniref:Uncharacterized protein n=1 Tax=Rotaria magnacalcarata TaxID=392030 RepID=A0A819B2N1_9BILA|nr:unnamed protein product [Rotaria magnacalcarata]
MSKKSGTADSEEKKKFKITTDDVVPTPTRTSVEKKDSGSTTNSDEKCLHYREFIYKAKNDLPEIEKTANDSSAGYHYQTAVVLFQAISMVCESSELKSFWPGRQWTSIVEEGVEDIDIKSTEDDRYLMQIKYRTSDTISLTAPSSDYFKHMIYHLRLAASNRTTYSSNKVKVVYWSFAKPQPMIASWQTELKTGNITDLVKSDMKNLLEVMTNKAKKDLKASDVTEIEKFLNDDASLKSFLTSHYIKKTILWKTLIGESLKLLTKYIETEFQIVENKEQKQIAEDLYYQLHHDIIDRNLQSSSVEISRQPLGKRTQETAERELEKSDEYTTLSEKNMEELKKLAKIKYVYNSRLSKKELILQILKEIKEEGSVQKEIEELKKNDADRVKKHRERSATEEFKKEIENRVETFQTWRNTSIQSSPAQWYINKINEAIPELQKIVDSDKSAEVRAKLLSGWFSQLCILYGSVPDNDRDERHEKERKTKTKRTAAAQQLNNDLDTVREKPNSFTEKYPEMKKDLEIVCKGLLEISVSDDNNDEEPSIDEESLDDE